jgi:hypothetical protein
VRAQKSSARIHSLLMLKGIRENGKFARWIPPLPGFVKIRASLGASARRWTRKIVDERGGSKVWRRESHDEDHCSGEYVSRACKFAR